jgi:hypothetical protein
MISFPSSKTGALLIVALALSACATSVSESDLYGPNYGLRVVPHFGADMDPDPTALANGIYGSTKFQYRCYRCSNQWPNSSDWAP